MVIKLVFGLVSGSIRKIMFILIVLSLKSTKWSSKTFSFLSSAQNFIATIDAQAWHSIYQRQ
jgi:hypothetical protein